MSRIKIPTIDTITYQGRAILHFHPVRHYYTVSVPSLEKWRIYQPGVTTILSIKDKSGPLCYWTADQCEVFGQIKVAENPRSWMDNNQILAMLREMKGHYREVKRKAAEIGSIVHDYLHEELLKRQSPGDHKAPTRPMVSDVLSTEMVRQANASIDAGLEFLEKHKIKPLTMERPVWSPSWGYIGTDDFIGLVDDELCVLDWKSSKSLYNEVWLQLAGYQEAYSEEHPDMRSQFAARWGVHIGKDGKLDAVRRGKEKFADDFGTFLSARNLWEYDRVESGSKYIDIIGDLSGVQIPDEGEEW